MESLALLLAVGYLLIASVLGIVAFSWVRGHRDEIDRLRRRVQALALQVDDLRTAGIGPVPDLNQLFCQTTLMAAPVNNPRICSIPSTIYKRGNST